MNHLKNILYSLLWVFALIAVILTACQTTQPEPPTAVAVAPTQPTPSPAAQSADPPTPLSTATQSATSTTLPIRTQQPPSPTITNSPTSTKSPTPTIQPTNTSLSTLTTTPSPTPTTTPSPTPFPWQPLFEEVTSISEPFPDAARSGQLFIAEDNSLMMVIDGMIVKWVDNIWETVLEDWPGSLHLWEGQIWAYDAETGVLSHWQNGTWQSYGPEEGWIKPEGELSRRSAQSAIYDDAGRLWLATRNEVRMLDNGRWTIFTPADMGITIEPDSSGATSHSFTIQPVPKLGEVWVGHCEWIPPGPNGGTGLHRFDGRSWQASPISELSEGCTIGMAADEFGRVFVSQDATLWYYDLGNQAWNMFDAPDSFLEEQYVGYGAILDISISPTGHIWPVYMACGGASCSVGEHRYSFFENGTFYPMWHPGDEARNPFVMLENGRVFKLTATGLYEITNTTTTLLLEPGILFGQLVADADGNVWTTNINDPRYLLKLKTE